MSAIVHCPTCDASRVRPSRLKVEDAIRLIALMRPVRCHSCGARFYCWRWEELESKKSGKT